MRRALIGVPLLLPSVFGFGAAWYLNRPEPEPIKPPILSWEQTPEHVLLHIHNVNATWGLRDQLAHVSIWGETQFFKSYHPGELEGADGRTLDCCRIALLPPGGDYTIELLPEKLPVAGIRVQLDNPDAWQRM